MTEYRLHEHQPDEATGRDTNRWRQWAAAQGRAEAEGKK
jgi:hypothetical protein